LEKAPAGKIWTWNKDKKQLKIKSSCRMHSKGRPRELRMEFWGENKSERDQSRPSKKFQETQWMQL